MKKIKSLKGVLVRNLVACAVPADTVGVGTAIASDAAGGFGAATGAGRVASHGIGDDVCFFSLHPIESATSKLSDTSIYVSTLCNETCNPSWSDVEHEDISSGWKQGWECSRIGIRIWTAARRAPPGAHSTEHAPSNGRPGCGLVPRVAPWERGTMLWECEHVAEAEAGKSDGGGVGMGAEVPDWARRGNRFVGSNGRRNGGLLGGGWVDSYRRGRGEFAHQRLEAVLALEACIVWSDWAVMETPLSQLRVPMPRNALFLTLADSTGMLNTHVDENNLCMSRLLNPVAATPDAIVGAESDSEGGHRESNSHIDGGSNGERTQGSAAAEEAALKVVEREKEREERERRKTDEREKEKQQRSLLLGSKDSRTPSSRGSGGVGHWGSGVGALKEASPGGARRGSDPMTDGGDVGRAGGEGCGSRQHTAVGDSSGSGAGAGGGVMAVKGIPHKCRLRAKALDASRAGLHERTQDTAQVKAKLEALLAIQGRREREQHRQNEMKLRLKQLRRRVLEEEASLDELKMNVNAQERRLENAAEKDTEKAAQTLRTRAITVLDAQAHRAKAAGEEAARRMGIDFALPPAPASDASTAVASSMEDATARHSQAMSSERKMLRELRRELKTRLHYLTASLHSTYPIFTAADGITRTICGLALPAPTALGHSDDEMLSTALGHTCHMVQLMAKYSCVCLRYQPIALASRSAMRDMTLNPTKTNLKDGSDFPLFSKGQDRVRLQTAMHMLGKDVVQLLTVHGLVPVDLSLQVTPYGTQWTVLANLQNIVITCRHRFLTAQGGLEALSTLDAQAIKALAITMDEGLELLGRSAGGSGGTSRASSDHGGAGSERRREANERALAANQQRLGGSEYVSGIAMRVDRLIESMMFPTVTTSAGNGYGEGEKDAEAVPSSGGKEKKKRKDGREGKERREGRRAREAGAESARDGAETGDTSGSAPDDSLVAAGTRAPNVEPATDHSYSSSVHSGGGGVSSDDVAAPEAPSAGASDVLPAAGSTAGRGGSRCMTPEEERTLMSSSLRALGGELPWGLDDMHAHDLHNDMLHAAAAPSSSVLDEPGGGSQALYEMFKAAADAAANVEPPVVDEGGWAMSHGRSENAAPSDHHMLASTSRETATQQTVESETGGRVWSPAPVAAAETGTEEAWAAGIDRWVCGPAASHPWVDLQ